MDSNLKYYIEEYCVHIFTKHLTTFVITATDGARDITDVILTVAALYEQTARKSIIQLRLMLHSHCAGMGDFSAMRKEVCFFYYAITC